MFGFYDNVGNHEQFGYSETPGMLCDIPALIAKCQRSGVAGSKSNRGQECSCCWNCRNGTAELLQYMTVGTPLNKTKLCYLELECLPVSATAVTSSGSPEVRSKVSAKAFRPNTSPVTLNGAVAYGCATKDLQVCPWRIGSKVYIGILSQYLGQWFPNCGS